MPLLTAAQTESIPPHQPCDPEPGAGGPGMEECGELATAMIHCGVSGLWDRGHRIARILFPAGLQYRPAIARFYWEMACFQDAGGEAGAARAAARLALAIDLRIEPEIEKHPSLHRILIYPSCN